MFDGALETLRQRFGGERALVMDFAEAYADVAVDGAQVAARDGRPVTYRGPEIEATVRRIYEGRLLDRPAPGRSEPG